MFRRAGLVALPAAFLMPSGAPQAQQQPNQNCVATMENRSVPVDQYGSYVIPNVPVNPGMYRARVVCTQPDGTILGSTSPYTILTPNGSTTLPTMFVGPLSPQPSALKVQVISGMLSSLGATVQLETQAINPTDFSTNPAFTSGSFAYDYTPLTEGTTYTTSNPAVATVDNNGVVTATGPGTVYITARNDGIASTIMLTSFGLLDSDGDGMPDIYEIANGLNPYDPTDAGLDPDGDGLTNLQEFQLGTNPHVADTDGDGLNDGDEIKYGTNPLVADTDGDGLSDGDEIRLGTNPLNPDTDGDGIPDGVEVKIGTNPLVPDVTTNVVGHVTQPNGTPYPGAAVVTISYFTGLTDTTGAFSLTNVPVTLGNIIVSAQAIVGTTIYNGASASTPAVGSGVTNVGTIQLGQSAGQVSGVVYSPDNKPVAGAQVTVVDGSDVRNTIADGNGIYVVTGLQMGGVSVAAFDAGTSLRGQATGTLGGSPLTLNITLAAFGTVSGTVSDATGAPVGKGVSVTISGALNATTATDSLGHYSFQFVPLGAFQVDATDANGNHGRTNGLVTATSQTLNENVQYLGRGTVSGTVSNSLGNTVAGAAITLVNNGVFSQLLTTTTNSLGQYSIPNVFVGNISVAAVLSASNTSANANGNLSANAQTLTLNLTLQPTANLTGTIFRKDGVTPVSGAVVSLSGTGFTTTANSSGQYSLLNIPLGSYTIVAADPSSTDRGLAPMTLSTAAQAVTANVNMLGVGAVVVTVLDGSGATVSGATISVAGGAPFYQTQNAVTGSNGTATVTQQLAGAVGVTATNPATGLGGTANATVTAGGSVPVTVNLQASGTITGTVYKHDATTPVPGATVVLDGNGQQTLTNASGVYTLSTVPTGSHNVEVVDSIGNILAVNNSVNVSSQGQSVTANFVIIARGTVTGQITNPDGSAAGGIPVQVTSSAGGDGNPYGTQSDVNGLYTVPLVPAGAYTVVAQSHTATTNLYGTAKGSLATDGAIVTTNVQLSASLVPSTTALMDGNGFTYPVRENAGLFDGSFAVFAGDSNGHEGGSLLSLVLNGNNTQFTGAPFSTSSLSGRQVSIEQDGLDGLNVVRRVYVPGDGYFARYVELLTNPTSSNITVGVQLNSYFRSANEFYKLNGATQLNSGAPHILATSSGDTVLNVNDPNTPDNWVTLGGPGDRDPFMQDQFADTPVPAIADVFSGPGATLEPSSANYVVDPSGSFSTLTENYASITVPAGGTVGILHFLSQENEYSASNASASRLVQLPPEALAGLTATDITAIANFRVPNGGASSVAALPSLDNQVNGFVYEYDGSTIVPGATVHLQSTDPIYARTYVTTADPTTAAYNFQGSYGGLSIAQENYSVYATDPLVTTPLTPECAQNGHYVGNGCAIDSQAVTGGFDPNSTQSATNISFTNTGILTGTISRGPTVLNVSGTVTIASSLISPLTLPIAADGTYKVVNLLPGSYTVTVQVTNTLLTGTGAATISAGQTTTTNINIEPSGSVQGTVKRADGSLAVNDVVNLRATGAVLQAVVDTSGHYAFTDIPTGMYTVDVYDGQSNAAASATVAVNINATTTQNLTLQSTGTVTGTVTVNDGSSVAGLTVTLTGTTSNGTQNLSTTTSSNGTFTFSGVTPGAIMLHTTTPAGLQGSASGSLPLAGQTTTINIALTSAGNVTGTVFQGDGTTPAAGIQVTISPAPLTGAAVTTTNSSGVYNFTNEAYGGFTVYASNTANGDRGQTVSQIQANGQLRTVNITLDGFGTVVVKVVDSSNNPVPSASVTLSDNSAGTNYTATTDSTGTATFSNLLTGTFQVSATSPASGLSATGNGTITYNATQTVTLTLQAVGTIQGVVYAPDGTTPEVGATVQLNVPYGPSTTTAADGSYKFSRLSVGGSYSIQARDANGLARAVAPAQILQTSGQIITQNLTFVGVGTVSGIVTNADGSRAENMGIQLVSKNSTVPSTQNTTTGGDGSYSVTDVAVGTFTVTVTNLSSNLAGFATGTIKSDGDQETANIQIQSSTVTLPVTLTDADGFAYPIQGNGVYGSTPGISFFGISPYYDADLLQVTVNGSTSTFGDNSSPTTSIQSMSGEQIEINQPSLQGLNVTRKIYVPTDGYFARRLEVLRNPTSSPVTVTVTLTGTERYSTLSPQVITTSNGNTTVNKSILWAVDDDDSGNKPYPASQPAHASVFAGAAAPTGMAAVSQSVAVYGGYYNQPTYSLQSWTYTYNQVTIPAGGTASFLFFNAQEATSATAATAAQRLVQLPAEALAGLSSTDLGNVVNFVVPSTPLAAIHPPATSTSLTGVVQTGDGTLPIPKALVYGQSTDLQYGSGASATADSSGNYSLPSLTSGSYAVEAVDPSTTITSPTFTGTITTAANPLNSQTQNIVFTNTGILSGVVKATGQASIGTGTVTVYMTCYGPGNGNGTYCGTVYQNYAADGTFQFLTIPAGNQGIYANITTPTGAYISLPQGGNYIVDVAAQQNTQFTFTIPAVGNVSGTVTNADGTPAAGVTVYAVPTNYNTQNPASVQTAANGTYAIAGLLLGTYTIQATDPSTAGTVSQTTNIMQDTTNTVNLQFLGKGTVVATVKYADGNIAQGATLYISTSTTPNFVYSGSTDTNGQFTFNNVPTGSFSVRAYYPGQNFYSTTTGTMTGNGNTVQLAVTLTPVGTITGTVTNADGTPAVQQFVSIKDNLNIYSSGAQTDSAGNYAITPVPADRTVSLTSSLYNSTTYKTVTAQALNQQVPGDGQTLIVNLRYPGTATVKVTVLNADGTPFTTGYVYLNSKDGSQHYSQNIGSDGTTTFTNVVEATFVTFANNYSQFNFGSTVFTLGPGDDNTTKNVTIHASPSGTVQGQVYASDGATVIRDGYSVKITDIDANTTNEADPNSGQGYTFSNVQVGASGFSITAALDAVSSITQTATGNITANGQTITQNFTLPTSSISGTVYLHDGVTPVPYANITANQTINGSTTYFQTQTDANGTYQFSGPVAGTVSVQASDDNGVVGVVSTTLSGNTSIVTGLNVNLGATGTVAGAAYSSAGQPLANAEIEIQSSGNNGGFNTSVVSDANGNYSVTDIPVGNITVSVYDSSSSQELSATGVLNNNGDSVTINVGNVPAPPATATEVFGTVYDENQNPAPGAAVTVTPSTQGAQIQTTTTDSNGLYSAGGLPVGSVTVSAVLADGTSAGSTTGAITDPQTPVEIDVGLQNPGVVSGLVLDSSGNPVANANINCASTGDTSTSYGEGTADDGSFYFPNIAPGTVTLTVTDNNGNVLGTATGTLPYGGNLTLNVSLQPATGMVKKASLVRAEASGTQVRLLLQPAAGAKQTNAANVSLLQVPPTLTPRPALPQSLGGAR